MRNLAPSDLVKRLARMLHHECDALEGYRFFWGDLIVLITVFRACKVLFNPSLLNWSSMSSGVLTVAHTEGDCRKSKTLTGWAEKAGKGKSMIRSFTQIIGMFHRCPQPVLKETAEQAKLSPDGRKKPARENQ